MTSVVEIQPTVTAPAHGQAHDRADRARRQAQDLRPVPTHQALAVVCALVCFAPLGIAAVVSAGNVRTRLALGDLDGARRASRTALRLCCASAMVTLFFLIVIVVGAGSYSDVH
jgi:Interferon-induced transmembrane protein